MLTNKHNLPDAIVKAVERHEHKSGSYSISMLSNSPRQVWLKRRHEAEAQEDVVDKVWALVGTAFHAVMEGNEGHQELSEQYMTQEVMPGVTLSGTADLYSGTDKCVTDYKTTSAWTIVYGSRMKEWTEQLNGYAWEYRKLGFEVNKLQIVALLRDWTASKYVPGGSYPECMIVTIDIPLWTIEEQELHISSRVALLESHKDTPDDELPLCTTDETWARDGKPPARCGQYCLGAAWCNQWKEYQIANPPKAKKEKK